MACGVVNQMRITKLVSFGALASILVAAPVLAADADLNSLDNYGQPYQDLSGLNPWSGFYVGVHGAYNSYSVKGALPGDSYSRNKSSFAYGVYGGYNYQHNRFVVGFDADANLSRAGNMVQYLTGTGAGGYIRHKPGYAVHARLRLGYVAQETLMPYIAGGFTSAKLNVDHIDSNGAVTLSDEKWLSGYTLGIGVAHAFSPNIISRIEFLWDEYNNANFTYTPVAGTTERGSLKMRNKTWRIGIAYKF